MSPKLHGELELELKPELKLGPLHRAAAMVMVRSKSDARSDR
jgi:hypothetical protein